MTAPAAKPKRPWGDLEEILESVARPLGAVGASAAVLSGGHVVSASFGLAHAELDRPVTPQTLFQIGSVTKLYTAVVVMRLVDRGLLDLDEPVRTYVPGLRLSDAEAQERLSLRHLLSMTSGLDNGPYDGHGWGDDAADRYVADLAQVPQVFPPGSAFGYSNAATVIAGYVVSRVLGCSWESALRDELLAPAGLVETASLLDELIFLPVAPGHCRNAVGEAELIRPWSDGRGLAACGSTLCASAADVARLAWILRSGGVAENGQAILSEGAADAMQQAQVRLPGGSYADHWCLGPASTDWIGGRVLGHGGTNWGGSATVSWSRECDLLVATATNTPSAGYPLHDGVLDAMAPALGLARRPEPPRLPTSTDQVRRCAGTYEASQTTLVFGEREGALEIRGRSEDTAELGEIVGTLVSRGGDWFTCDDSPVLGAGWSFVFWGDDEQGRATHVLNDVFPARRVEATP
jgi:CubicO group peptidase (beta-lactamase class C family)